MDTKQLKKEYRAFYWKNNRPRLIVLVMVFIAVIATFISLKPFPENVRLLAVCAPLVITIFYIIWLFVRNNTGIDAYRLLSSCPPFGVWWRYEDIRLTKRDDGEGSIRYEWYATLQNESGERIHSFYLGSGKGQEFFDVWKKYKDQGKSVWQKWEYQQGLDHIPSTIRITDRC